MQLHSMISQLNLPKYTLPNAYSFQEASTWDKTVPRNETALPKLKSMLSGKYLPWKRFDISNADILFWSSGVWDVAFKQNLKEYENNLRGIAALLKVNLRRTMIVFRTILRFAFLPRSRECGWRKTVDLITSYNSITRQIAHEFQFSLVDVETIPRDDEIYDGIHFARSRVAHNLTGECNRAISNIFANVVSEWCVRHTKI